MTSQEQLAILKQGFEVWNKWRKETSTSVVDLYGANLKGANLSKANLGRANLIYAKLGGADLSGADLSRANLSGADLRTANLSEVNLIGANLRSANLMKANLIRADLSGADLSGADLFYAELSGADLSEANLSGANLKKTIHDPDSRKVSSKLTDDLECVNSDGTRAVSEGAPEETDKPILQPAALERSRQLEHQGQKHETFWSGLRRLWHRIFR